MTPFTKSKEKKAGEKYLQHKCQRVNIPNGQQVLTNQSESNSVEKGVINTSNVNGEQHCKKSLELISPQTVKRSKTKCLFLPLQLARILDENFR